MHWSLGVSAVGGSHLLKCCTLATDARTSARAPPESHPRHTCKTVPPDCMCCVTKMGGKDGGTEGGRDGRREGRREGRME